MAGGGQIPNLLGFLPQVDCAWSQFQVKVDWFPFQLNYLEFHIMSVRRGELRVNARVIKGMVRNWQFRNQWRV
jgi:hypothetical protein